MIGRNLGHYEIVGKLGEGGMGAVYKAKDSHLDRFVALKVLPHEKVTDPERKRRFTQEAKAASALNHPNIITIYDISSSDGVDYIAMEFVEGRTMEALIAAGPLRVSDTIRYARQMADALSAAHAAGILHRDLKPANVMVRESGLVKVLDFGLAKLTDEGSDPSITDTTRTMSSTRAGQILGTVAYMSPEQAEGKKVDFRSDIFSFGVVLYEMASGTRAFPGDSQASVLAALLRDEPRPLRATRGDMPQELDQLIARCLRKDPARRVQTMADLKAALDDLPDLLTKSSLSTVSASSLPVPPPIPAPAPVIAPPPVPVYSIPVPALPPPPLPLPPLEDFDPPRRPRRSGRLWFFLALVFLLPVFKSVLTRSRTPAPAPTRTEVVILNGVPLTGNAGTERTPSFSPDGTHLVYSWNGPNSGNFDIYTKSLGDDPPFRLTTDAQEDYAPAWSPDGDTIAFLRTKPASDEILLIPSAGGPERKIGEIAHGGDRYGLAWKKDSQHLIVSDTPSQGAGASLYELTLATGEKKRITKPLRGGEGDFFPSISPRGDTVAFVRNPGGFRAELMTLDLTDEDASPQKVAGLKMDAAHPVWSADGKQLIFAAGVAAAPLLWRVAADDSGKPMPLLGLGSGGEPALSLQGSRLVYSGKIQDKKSRSLLMVENFR